MAPTHQHIQTHTYHISMCIRTIYSYYIIYLHSRYTHTYTHYIHSEYLLYYRGYHCFGNLYLLIYTYKHFGKRHVYIIYIYRLYILQPIRLYYIDINYKYYILKFNASYCYNHNNLEIGMKTHSLKGQLIVQKF